MLQNAILQKKHQDLPQHLEKRNLLFNLISYQPDIDKLYLYAKDPYRAND